MFRRNRKKNLLALLLLRVSSESSSGREKKIKAAHDLQTQNIFPEPGLLSKPGDSPGPAGVGIILSQFPAQ
jgi:hypothetical protein